MIFARRYHWQSVEPTENTALLDAFVAHPEFLAYPHPPEEARQIGASLLTNPHNLVWATYDKTTLTGVVILTRVVPKVDALLHFFFTDANLAGKRKLLKNLIGHCFSDLGFNRLSMEVPEGTRLERFARKVLQFKLEGESRARNSELPKCLDDVWVARQGSRRQEGYYNGTVWSDVALLRLLANEWVGNTGGGDCQSDQPQEPSLPPLRGPLPEKP